MRRESNNFSYLELDPSENSADRTANLEKIAEAIEDFFISTNQHWAGPKIDLLELVVKQTIGIILKAGKASDYI